jgi:hypothetical protein
MGRQTIYHIAPSPLLLARLWLSYHALLVVAGFIYAGFVWPEPLPPL